MQAMSEVRVELRGTRLPGARFEDRGAVRVGIQAGREVADDIPADAEEATFAATLRVARMPDGAFDFRGPYVFGTRGDRFLYLCWGERTGGWWDGFRRAKIKLGNVPPAVWEEAIAEGRAVIGSLELTDAKGGPKCASLRPEEVEWSAGRSS